MKDGTTLVLLEFDHDPERRQGSSTPSLTDYTPEFRPIPVDPRPDTPDTHSSSGLWWRATRAPPLDDLPRSHWFWSVVKLHWRSYGHIALAAFLINMLALATPLLHHERLRPRRSEWRNSSLIALSIGMGSGDSVRLRSSERFAAA